MFYCRTQPAEKISTKPITVNKPKENAAPVRQSESVTPTKTGKSAQHNSKLLAEELKHMHEMHSNELTPEQQLELDRNAHKQNQLILTLAVALGAFIGGTTVAILMVIQNICSATNKFNKLIM